jgi:NADH-quinone oxidoreductase subunit M
VLVADRLAIDAVSAPYVSLAALICSISLLAAPARELTTRSVCSALTALFGSFIAFAAQGLGTFVLGWLVSLCGIGAALPRGAKLRGTYAAYVTLGSLPLLAALAILGPAHLTSFAETPAQALSPRAQHAVFWLAAIAAAFRSGLFPLHSWLPALCQRAPVTAASLLFGAQLGPVLIARGFGPIAPNVAADDMHLLAIWALASAVFSALLGLVQRDIKRSLGFVLSSQSCLLLFGVCDSALETRHGALLATIALGLTGSGMLLVAALLADREQSSDIGVLEGRGLRYPRLTALFFLFASAAIGLPGSLHFVAEDLLLHGLLHGSPLLAFVLLFVGVLNGVGLLRLFFVVFQGPARVRHAARAQDLQLSHVAIISGLLLVTMVSGLAPEWLLRLQERSAYLRTTHHSVPVASAAP